MSKEVAFFVCSRAWLIEPARDEVTHEAIARVERDQKRVGAIAANKNESQRVVYTKRVDMREQLKLKNNRGEGMIMC